MKHWLTWLLLAALVASSLTIYQYNNTSNQQTATAVFEPLDNQLVEQNIALGLDLWRQELFTQASEVFSTLAEKPLDDTIAPQVGLYQFYTQAYSHNNNADLKQNLKKTRSCPQQILFVTPNINSLLQAERFRHQFSQDKRFSELSICIHDTIWLEPQKLSCEANWQGKNRLGCNLVSLAKQLEHIPFTHLVVFAGNGKANVHNGIMFLDQHDTYDVFVHELAHFSGFIDEYPLGKELAKRVCAGVDAPNVVFKPATHKQVNNQYWQTLGLDHRAQLTEARTCDNHSTQAFKGSAKLTFMEYHDVAYIPEAYLYAWQKQLQNLPTHPSAHLNFAQLFEALDYPQGSQYWRARYLQYLTQE